MVPKKDPLQAMDSTNSLPNPNDSSSIAMIADDSDYSSNLHKTLMPVFSMIQEMLAEVSDGQSVLNEPNPSTALVLFEANSHLRLHRVVSQSVHLLAHKGTKYKRSWVAQGHDYWKKALALLISFSS